MSGSDPTAKPATAQPGPRDYVRFIILSAARTGSNMLASSLNTSPSITCFRELFNKHTAFIDYNVEGYDRFSAEDRALRDRDFKAFLHQRIFCRHAEDVGAVGFKMPYEHFRWFPGLREWLSEQHDIRVVHLRRRNLLRSLVSVRVAQMTGAWVLDQKVTLRNSLTPANALKAARHPLRAATTLRKLLRPKKAAWKALRTPVTLRPEECRFYFDWVDRTATDYGGSFGEHPLLTVYYEDLLGHPTNLFSQVQSFLGVEPRPLRFATRQQNPEPLRELIANYDELHEAFAGTPEAAFLD